MTLKVRMSDGQELYVYRVDYKESTSIYDLNRYHDNPLVYVHTTPRGMAGGILLNTAQICTVEEVDRCPGRWSSTRS